MFMHPLQPAGSAVPVIFPVRCGLGGTNPHVPPHLVMTNRIKAGTASSSRRSPPSSMALRGSVDTCVLITSRAWSARASQDAWRWPIDTFHARVSVIRISTSCAVVNTCWVCSSGSPANTWSDNPAYTRAVAAASVSA